MTQELVIIVYQSKVTAELGYVRGDRRICDILHLLRRRVNASGINVIAQERH